MWKAQIEYFFCHHVYLKFHDTKTAGKSRVKVATYIYDIDWEIPHQLAHVLSWIDITSIDHQNYLQTSTGHMIWII